MKSDCTKVQALSGESSIGCYAGQFQKYEGLTVNFAEAVNGAGGVIVGDDGKPNVNTDAAKAGWNTMVGFYKDGTIPKAAITWQEEQGRQAFQNGNLVFLRNWSYVYNLANKTDGSSKIPGDFDIAPLPGLTGPGVSSLGGHNMAIAANATNKGTAADFIKFMTSEATQKSNTLATSNAPTLTSLYTDADSGEEVPVHADPAQVHPDCEAAAQGRRLHRRHPGHPGRRLQLTAGHQHRRHRILGSADQTAGPDQVVRAELFRDPAPPGRGAGSHLS